MKKEKKWGSVIYRWKNKEGKCRWVVNCRKGKMEYWARIVYQNYYLRGEEIPKGIVIHHKDKNTENDIPDNLEGKFSGIHTRDHHIGIKRPDVGEWNKKYKPEQMLGNKNPMFGKKRPEVSERNRTIKVGNKNNAKLNKEEVADIKRLLREKQHPKNISVMFNVSIPTICAIKYNKVWKEIS